MYLMQMGEIPLLNRDHEVASAEQIEATRRRFRRTMLCSDYVLHAAVELLQKVADGKLRLDRTIEVSVTNTTEKKRILKRIGPNLVDRSPPAVARTSSTIASPSASKRRRREKRAAWRRLIVRRNKVVRLVEELNLRIQRLQPLMGAAARNRRADGVAQAATRRRRSGCATAATSTSCGPSCTT